MLGHLDHEISRAGTETAVAELLVERARLLEAAGARDATPAAWEAALARAPGHAAALKGLEADLAARTAEQTPDAYEAYIVHLSAVADAYAGQPELAAWIHVERALILDWKLGRPDAAKGALGRAVRMAPDSLIIRRAHTQLLATHGDLMGLARALEDEARLETDRARCARLELEAATIAEKKLNDDSRAMDLLERAAGRAPTTPLVDRRVLDDLARLHELAGHWNEASLARRRRLHHLTDNASIVHELRALSAISERLGDLPQATLDMDRARSLAEGDALLLEELDRLLAAGSRDDERVSLWSREAERATEPARRAKALVRAALLAEVQLGRPEEATRLLKLAWIAAPGDPEVTDALSRMMAPAVAAHADRDLRSLIELYQQAAKVATDPGRKVAYLEKAALLWEDLVGDPRRAARIFEEILDLQPGRRGAILGLARTAHRLGDERGAAKALLEEARLAEDGTLSLGLQVRAAEALARTDATRALALVGEVLAVDTAHAAGRALETRLHEEAGRWELVAQSLRVRVEHALTTQEKIPLYLALAQIQRVRLRAPLAALESLKAARALDPTHPVPPEEIGRVLEEAADDDALSDACVALASDAITPLERAHHYMRAAEIAELRLGDDPRAASLWAKALAELPEEDCLVERMDRVYLRRALATVERVEGGAAFTSSGLMDRKLFLENRIRRSHGADLARHLRTDLACILHMVDQDTAEAVALAGAVLEASPANVAALRLLEALFRKAGAWQDLARALGRQGAAFIDAKARLGALWSLAGLEEWRTGGGDSTATYDRILEIDPTDQGALDAVVRKELPRARRGDAVARRAVLRALRALSGLSTDEGPHLAVQLRTALLLEIHEKEVGTDEPGLVDETLERYRVALGIEPLSVTAATGLARLANRTKDVACAVQASISLADLAIQPAARARYLIDAADHLTGPVEDERLGSKDARDHRAAMLLEQALVADADSLGAAARLARVRTSLGQAERLVDTFRGALFRARTAPAIIQLGTEIAKVARDELQDLVVAIDAITHVRHHAPDHVPTLLTLSELYIAQRVWPEATRTLEEVVVKAKDVPPRLTALFALASIYDKILGRPDDGEDALRRALGVDGTNPRAIRALIHHLAAKAQAAEEPSRKLAPKLEIASLLERLADVEKDPAQKCEILLELVDIRTHLKDTAQAERALIEAVAHDPRHARAFARLGRFYRGAAGFDAVSYARALATVIGRGQALGHEDARWYATLGHVEVESLARLRDGAAHLKRAVQMQPTLYESQLQLAQAQARMGANDEAGRTLMTMISPTADPLARLAKPAVHLELLEKTLNAERRPEEAIVVSELRAICGELDEGRHAWLRARRLGMFEPHHAILDRQTLVSHVLPVEGRHVLLEIAAAVSGLETRLLRADLSDLGVTSRDKIGRRSGHPTRVVLDRLMKALGLSDVELVVTDRVARARVVVQDALWVLVPRTLTELPEPTQLAALARSLARIALAVPWLEELPAAHMEAYLVACGRQVQPHYASQELEAKSQQLSVQYEERVAKEISRKQRQALEKLGPHLGTTAARPVPVEVLVGALAKAELRTAYLLTGDVLATIDELRGLDAALLEATEVPGRTALLAVLDHPFAGDVARFALSPEATALRRRAGSTWAG